MATFDHTIRAPLNGVTMTMEVKPVYTLEFHLRMKVGVALLRMAARVLGCNFQFGEGDEVDA